MLRRGTEPATGVMGLWPAALAVLLLGLVDGRPSQAAETIEGRASVIDGDTVEIHGQHIRLHGIDAPESNQVCQRAGKPYRCGQQAAQALDSVIEGKTLRCISKDRDQYNRRVAECWAGGLSLNAWMVEEGWALAYRKYSSAYIKEEASARKSKSGIWSGEFDAPWDFRHRSRRRGETSSHAGHGCPADAGRTKE